MKGKTILITGATAGIGKETARGLAKLGATMVVTGRDATRGEEAVAELRSSTGNDRVHLLLGDLSAQAEIRGLADEFRRRFDRLDVLINNLGGLYGQPWRTADGVEATFAVNALTPFVLTHALLGTLQASAPSRVINVTGGMPTVPLELGNLQGEVSFRGLDNYSLNKVAMMALAYEFAQRLEGSGVSVDVVYPGAAATDMTLNMTPDMMPAIMRLMMPVMLPLMRFIAKPEKAARSSIHAASAPKLEGATARYFDSRGRESGWPKAILDDDARQTLWSMAEQLTGVGEGRRMVAV